MKNKFIVAGALLGAFAVAIGAFGAHALKDFLLQNNTYDTFQTASKYHFYHVFALLVIGILSQKKESRWLNLAGIFQLAGIFIFSGSLYALCLTNIKWLGAITPIGGVALIVGWIFLALSQTR